MAAPVSLRYCSIIQSFCEGGVRENLKDWQHAGPGLRGLTFFGGDSGAIYASKEMFKIKISLQLLGAKSIV